jgi:hypothetical protein
MSSDSKIEALIAELKTLLQSKYAKPENSTALQYLNTSGWADHDCYARYLRARKLDVDDAAKALLATAAWRVSYGVDTLNSADLQEPIQRQNFRLSPGVDRAGRPIVMTIKKAEEGDEDYELSVRNIVYTLEKAVASMPREHEKWIWVMDLSAYSQANRTPLSVTRQTMDIFSSHYPERLHRCFIIDAPWAFRMIWRIISPFIDSVTTSKIAFINDRNSAEFKAAIHETIAPEQLEKVSILLRVASLPLL